MQSCISASRWSASLFLSRTIVHDFSPVCTSVYNVNLVVGKQDEEKEEKKRDQINFLCIIIINLIMIITTEAVIL